MSFSVNHKQARQGRYLPPDGLYEVVFSKAAVSKSPSSGKRWINFTFLVRSDVVQDEKGEEFEFAMFPLNTPSSRDPEGYKLGIIQTICKCAGIAEGMNFSSIADWLDALVNQPIKVVVRHRIYNDQDKIDVLYQPTDFPHYTPGATISDDDPLF